MTGRGLSWEDGEKRHCKMRTWYVRDVFQEQTGDWAESRIGKEEMANEGGRSREDSVSIKRCGQLCQMLMRSSVRYGQASDL